MPGEQGGADEGVHAQIEATGEGFEEGPASGGAGCVQGHAREEAGAGLEAFHVLPADVDDVGGVGHEAAGGLEVGHRLHVRGPGAEGGLRELRAVARGGAGLDPRAFGQAVREVREVGQEPGERIALMQIVVVALCVALGCASGPMVMQLLTPVSQMIEASRAISRSQFDTPDIPLPKQPEIGQLAESFNRMKHSMAQQVNTLQEKNEIERELHRQKTEALELQNRMERSRMQQLRSQIDPHFLFNTLNVILQTAGQEKAYRTQALITALSHLLRYSLMSNDEQVPLAREVRIVDDYYSIYHVRFGDRVKMRWCISDSIDLTETMVPSFILQPIVENAFKHGIAPKEEGGAVRIRITPLRKQGLLRISVCDNGLGIEPEQLARLQAGLAAPGDRWEHIGVYNVAARLRLLDKRCRFEVRSHPGRGTAVSLYLPLVELTEEEDLDDDSPVDCG